MAKRTKNPRTRRATAKRTRARKTQARRTSARKNQARRTGARKAKGTKKLNPYFEKMLNAKANNEPSFKYNGKTYNKRVTKTGMVIYKGA